MPTLVKTRKVVSMSGTRLKARQVAEPETKADASTEEVVVVDKGLLKLVNDWEKADKQAGSYFARICEYVHDNEGIKKSEMKKALIDVRGMKEMTANNEVSKIWKIKDNEEVLEQLLAGDITVQRAKELVTTKQEGTDDDETKLEKSLKRAATFGIEKLSIEAAEFIGKARASYKEALAKAHAKAERQAENGEGGEEGEEEEEE
jgi:hypothetical protein